MRSLLGNGAGLAASVLFVFGVIGAANACMKGGIFVAATARKAIHIALAHWWLIAMALFDDPWAASAGPAASLLAAAVIPGMRILPPGSSSLGRRQRRDTGTMLYSASLLVLVNVCWRGVLPVWVGAIGVLIMGWGDGLAGLIGARPGAAGVRIWGQRKTVRGTVVMFLASFAVTLILTLLFNHRASGAVPAAVISVSTAAAATGLELFTPLGLDNLTVSVGTAFLYAGAFA